MPMVNGKKFPYTAKGKEDAKMAAKKQAVQRMAAKKKSGY